MPVNIGKEDDSGFTGLTGNFNAKPVEIAEKLVVGKEDRPDAVRVVFEVEGKDETVSLFVPLHESAADRLHPFIAGVKDVPTDEAGLRAYLAANMPGDTFFVYASNGSVRGVTAPPGKHRIKLTGLHQFTRRSDSQLRARFFAETRDRETVTWTVEYKGITTKLGKTPVEDDINIPNGNPYLLEYLLAFGLDWEKMVQEISNAYEGGHLFSRLGLDGPVPGLFNDPGDLTDELFQMTHRHSPGRWCEVEVVDHPEHGIGPKRGEWSHITFTPIIVEGGGATNVEFDREVKLFLELWDNATKAILKKDAARFIAGHEFTDDGKTIALATLKPLVTKYPDAVVTGKNPDGTPALYPPGPQTWALDGIVCANFTAERLLALNEEDLFRVVSLSDPTSFLAWAEKAVPEWATVGQESKGGAL